MKCATDSGMLDSSLIMVSKATFLGTWGDEAELDAVVARA